MQLNALFLVLISIWAFLIVILANNFVAVVAAAFKAYKVIPDISTTLSPVNDLQRVVPGRFCFFFSTTFYFFFFFFLFAVFLKKFLFFF